MPTRVVLLVALALVPMLALPSGTARAQDETLNLQQALARTLDRNKRQTAFEHRLAEQEGRVLQAGLLPNPELKVEIEDMSGTGRFDGFDSSQTTLSLEWVLEGWIRRRRVGAEQARSEGIDLEARILRLDLAAETAQRFVTSLEHQARLAAADEAVALAEATVAAIDRQAEAGKASRVDRTRAESGLALVRLFRDDVEHDLASAHHRLAAQWGETEPSFARVDGELLSLPKTESFESLTARLERNAEIQRLLSEERLAAANQRLAEARRWPTWSPRLGARRYQASDDVALVAELKVDLPVFDRNQGRVAESRATLARVRADTEAMRVEVMTTLFEMYEELQHHFHRVVALRNEVLPRLEGAEEAMQRGFERGRYSYFELRLVQEELLEARSELIGSSADAHRLVIALERLTGERVTRP